MAQNVTTQELQKALEQLAAQQGKSVHAYIQSQGFAKEADLEAKINGVMDKISAITKIESTDAEDVAKKISTIQEILNKEDGVVQQILDKIATNAKGISENAAKIDNNFKLLSDAINTLKKSVTANSESISSLETKLDSVSKNVTDVNTDLSSKIKEVKTTVDTLGGDDSVEGSIANMIKKEADRAKAVEAKLNEAMKAGDAESIKEAVAQAKAYTDSAAKEIVENADFASNKVVKTIQENITKIKSILNDSTDEKGNLVPGLVSIVKTQEAKIKKEITDRESAVATAIAEAKAYTDANTLNAKDLNIEVVVSIFDKALNGEVVKTTKTTTDSTKTDSTKTDSTKTDSTNGSL